MTDQPINDYTLDQECKSIAAEIFAEMLDGMAEDETPEDHRDDMSDRAHEAADMHQWVIYHHYAHQLCANCNTDNGEAFLEDVGMPETPTYDSLGVAIAYGEMRARIDGELQEMAENWEGGEA